MFNNRNESPMTNTIAETQLGLARLIEAVSTGRHLDGAFSTARALLGAWPLTTADYGVALCRLDNARRYMDFDERGAALYELRLLRTALCVAPLPSTGI